MGHAVPMGVPDRLGQPKGVLQQLLGGQATGGDQSRQRRTVDELHADEVSAVVLGDRLDALDVGVVERRDLGDLALETFHAVGFVDRRKNANRNEAIIATIRRLPDVTATPPADLLQEPEVRKQVP